MQVLMDDGTSFETKELVSSKQMRYVFKESFKADVHTQEKCTISVVSDLFEDGGDMPFCSLSMEEIKMSKPGVMRRLNLERETTVTARGILVQSSTGLLGSSLVGGNSTMSRVV